MWPSSKKIVMDAADDIIFRSAWRLDDQQIVRDARQLWQLENIPPRLTKDRERELCAAAYCGEALAAVSTARHLYSPEMRHAFFGYRCLVSPDFRRQDIAWKITAYSIKLLQEWAAQNSEEKVLGLLIHVETDKFDAGLRRPIREKFGLNMHFVGYTEDGQQMRVIWFDGVTLG